MSVGSTGSRAKALLSGAAERGDAEAVASLVARGCDVNGVDQCGQTPLVRAARKGRLEMVALLLAQGAAVSAAAKSSGYSPLIAAAHRGSEPVVALLLCSGADVHHRDAQGWTAFMVAAAYANAGVLRLLANAGADAFAQSNARVDAVSVALDEPTRRLVLQLRERQVARLALVATAARLATHPLFDRRALRATGAFLWGRVE